MPRLKRNRNLSKQTMIMHTKNPGHVCEMEWKIDNVLQFPDESFISKVKLGRGCKTKINLIVKIKEGEYYSDFVIRYERTDQSKTAIRVIFDVELVSSKGDVYMKKKVSFSSKNSDSAKRILKIKFADPDYFASTPKLTEEEIPNCDDDTVLKNLVSRGLVVWDKESLNKLYSLPDDSINVKGSVKVFACCVPLRTTPINKNLSEDIPHEQSELASHLKTAFINATETGQFTDISLCVGEDVVRAHKFILSARSPKFEKLLRPDSEGLSVNEIALRGMEKSVLLYFLKYLYTGVIGLVKWDVIEKLYEVAILFEVNSLLEHCRHTLLSNIKDRRACRALLFAQKHKDDELKKAAINYIKNIISRYTETNIWISFRENHPGLANEVMNSVVADLK